MMQLWLHHVQHVTFSVKHPAPHPASSHSSNRLFTAAVTQRMSATRSAAASQSFNSALSPRVCRALAMSRARFPSRRNKANIASSNASNKASNNAISLNSTSDDHNRRGHGQSAVDPRAEERRRRVEYVPAAAVEPTHAGGRKVGFDFVSARVLG